MVAAEKLIGRLVEGKYRVVEYIGRGGTGHVYRAHQDAIDRDVAIKVLHIDKAVHPKKVERFLQEARIHSQMAHENIAQIYSAGTLDEGQPYIVYEYIDGKTLAQVLDDEKKLEAPKVVPIALQVCAALQAAHELGIVHRDLKPSNILLCETAGKTVKLIDFGTAKVINSFRREDMDYRSLTATGTMVGTPAYISPEEIQGTDVDNRADIYALGCVLFEMLTGDVPFHGKSEYDVFMRHIKDPIPEMDDIPAKFEQVIMRCLAKKPEERFNSVSEIAEILANESVTASLVHSASRRKVETPQPKKKPSIPIANIAIAFLAVAIVGVGAFRYFQRAPSAPAVKSWAQPQKATVPAWTCDPSVLPSDAQAVRYLNTIDEQIAALEKYLQRNAGFNRDIEHRLMLLYSNIDERKAAVHADRILQVAPDDEHTMAHLLGGKTAETPYAQHYLQELLQDYSDLPNLSSACRKRLRDHAPILLPKPIAVTTADLKAGHQTAGRIPVLTLQRGKHIFPGVGNRQDWLKADQLAMEANALFDRGQIDQANAKLLEAVDLYGNDGHHLNTFGMCQVKFCDLIAAERAFRESAKVAPDLWCAWDNLARALYYQRRYTEARWAWEQTLRHKPPANIADNTRKNVDLCKRQLKQTGDGGPILL